MKQKNTRLPPQLIGIALIGIVVVVVAAYLVTTWLPWQDRVSRIASLVADSGQVQPAATKDEVTQEPAKIEGNYRQTRETHDVVENIDNVTYLGLNDDVIWAGSLIRGSGLNSFDYTPITIERAPITISLSLESATGTGDKITKTIADPSLSTVRQGISDLLKEAITGTTTVPARVDFKYERVYNESQLNLVVGANVAYGAGSLKTRFNWNSNTNQTKVIARYQQIYYTVDIDTPQTPADLFAPSVSTDQLAKAVPPGSLPVYVSSVSYGMMALMFIESSHSEQEIKAALDAGYGTVGMDVKISGDLTAKNILEDSRIQIVVYGGSTAGLKDLESGYTGFKNVIEASGAFGPDSPGVPLAYRFRNASDNTLAAVTLTSQYTLVHQLLIRQPVQISVMQLECDHAEDDEILLDDIQKLELRPFEIRVTILDPKGESVISDRAIFKAPPLYNIKQGNIQVTTPAGQYNTVSPLTVTLNTEEYKLEDYRLIFKWTGIEEDTSIGNTSDGFQGEVEYQFAAPMDFDLEIKLDQALNNFTIRANIKVELR